MKRIVTRSVIAVAALLLLSIASCKNDPEVNIPLIDYILITEEYLDVKSGMTEYDDSMAMNYNDDMQLVGIDGLYTDFDLFYDDAGRLSKTEIYNSPGAKAEYSSYIEYTWTTNTVTAQEYYAPLQPYYYKIVFTFNANDQVTKMERFEEPNKGEWYLMGYADLTWASGNLTKYEEYSENYKSSSGGKHSFSMNRPAQTDFSSFTKGNMVAVLIYEMDVEYDNNTNPFVAYPALAILFAEDMPHIFMSKNNPTFSSNAEYIEGTYSWDVDFTYEFNNQGFPVVVGQFESYDNWSYVETWIIAYK